MAKQLGQESIDELFAAAQAALGETVWRPGAEAGPELYNFSRAGQISNEQMRAISTVNDLFARNLMHSLGVWLRTAFEVKLVAGEQLPYGEFVERLARPTYVCSMRLEPFDAIGLMEVDLTLAWPIVDVLLGGVGQAAEARELTDIEEAVLVSVVRRIVHELNVAWKPVGLQMAFERRETEDHAERMMTATEKTLCVSFEVRVPEAQGVSEPVLSCFGAECDSAADGGGGWQAAEALKRGADEDAGVDGRRDGGGCAAVSYDAVAGAGAGGAGSGVGVAVAAAEACGG